MSKMANRLQMIAWKAFDFDKLVHIPLKVVAVGPIHYK